MGVTINRIILREGFGGKAIRLYWSNDRHHEVEHNGSPESVELALLELAKLVYRDSQEGLLDK